MNEQELLLKELTENVNTFKNKMAEMASAKENFATKEATDKLSSELFEIGKNLDLKTKDLEDAIVKIGNEVQKANAKQNAEAHLKHLIYKTLTSKEFSEKLTKGKADETLREKDFSFTDDHTGNSTITRVISGVKDEQALRQYSVRDLFSVFPTDMPSSTFAQFVSAPLFAGYYSENGELGEVNFSTKEVTVPVMRVGKYTPISKRAMKTGGFGQSIAARLAKIYFYSEDYALLYGASGDTQVDGIFTSAEELSVTGASFSAGAIASIASLKSGASVKVTFAAAHGLRNGWNITFENATATKYNTTFAVNVIDEAAIEIFVSYTAEADTSAWTATTAFEMADAVDSANLGDALVAAIALMRNKNVNVNGIVMNPAMAGLILTAKGTDGHFVYTYSSVNGVDMFGGIPIVWSDAVSGKHAFLGDWSVQNAYIEEYTTPSLTVSEDNESRRKNQVQAMVDGEVILTIINPFAFGYADLSTIMADIETPV